jgi:hypothetical protein
LGKRRAGGRRVWEVAMVTVLLIIAALACAWLVVQEWIPRHQRFHDAHRLRRR